MRLRTMGLDAGHRARRAFLLGGPVALLGPSTVAARGGPIPIEV